MQSFRLQVTGQGTSYQCIEVTEVQKFNPTLTSERKTHTFMSITSNVVGT